MDEVETLREENKVLKRQVIVEIVRRLSAERQALEATLSFVQVRGPQVDLELDLAKKKLADITKGDANGPASN